MYPVRSCRRRPDSWGRRLAASVLFALQIAVAISPLWESRGDGPLSAHAERNGARHVNAHDEATCALCSARAQASLTAFVAAPLAAPAMYLVPARLAGAAASRVTTATNCSRAPPGSG